MVYKGSFQFYRVHFFHFILSLVDLCKEPPDGVLHTILLEISLLVSLCQYNEFVVLVRLNEA